jgi:hypothetical protein
MAEIEEEEGERVWQEFKFTELQNMNSKGFLCER